MTTTAHEGEGDVEPRAPDSPAQLSGRSSVGVLKRTARVVLGLELGTER